ncbi:MAG: cupin domain-containing protein [Rhodospirillaceae bacterium]|nr:cupin domain-containing protein [Rhodospirillaceae bacterium]
MKASGNMFDGAAGSPAEEQVFALLERPGLRIERIVSTGQASPPGFWYDQPGGEWVLLVEGAAAVEFEGEPEPVRLGPGDYLWIPAHRRHRVAWTAADRPTVWLAVHEGAG